MTEQKRGPVQAKRIALIAHDNMKSELIQWVRHNKELLSQHTLFATGTTGKLIEAETELEVYKYQSGPVGGDLQVGAQIAESKIDCLVFFWDPLEPQPHDPDIKALLRIAVVWNIPIACNRASADHIITSPLISQRYQPKLPDRRAFKRFSDQKSGK